MLTKFKRIDRQELPSNYPPLLVEETWDELSRVIEGHKEQITMVGRRLEANQILLSNGMEQSFDYAKVFKDQLSMSAPRLVDILNSMKLALRSVHEWDVTWRDLDDQAVIGKSGQETQPIDLRDHPTSSYYQSGIILGSFVGPRDKERGLVVNLEISTDPLRYSKYVPLADMFDIEMTPPDFTAV